MSESTNLYFCPCLGLFCSSVLQLRPPPADDRDQQRFCLMPCRPIRQPRTTAPPASAVARAPTKGEESMPLPLHTSTQLRPRRTSSICPIALPGTMCLCLWCNPLTQTQPPAITLQDSLTAVLSQRQRPTRALASGLPLMPSTTNHRVMCPATRTLARCSMPTTMVRPTPLSTTRPGRPSRMAIRTSMPHQYRQPANRPTCSHHINHRLTASKVTTLPLLHHTQRHCRISTSDRSD